MGMGGHLRPERLNKACVMACVTTLDDLAAGQLFIGIPETALLLNRDERTIRRAVERGEIPGQKFGARWSIPTAWVRQQAGITEGAPAAVAPGMDELAGVIADKVVARLAEVLAAAQPEAQAR